MHLSQELLSTSLLLLSTKTIIVQAWHVILRSRWLQLTGIQHATGMYRHHVGCRCYHGMVPVHDGDGEMLQPEHELRLPSHWLLPSVSLKQRRQRVMKPDACRDITFEWMVVTCESMVSILDDMLAMASSIFDCSVVICSCKLSFSEWTSCSCDSAVSILDLKSSVLLGSDSSASIRCSSALRSCSDDCFKLSYNHRPHQLPLQFQITNLTF